MRRVVFTALLLAAVSSTAAAQFGQQPSGFAVENAAFRPRYPAPLFDFLAEAAPSRNAAWDCGTGSGQTAGGLAQHFSRVTATDASEAQIAHATPHVNVTYQVARAEASGLPNESVDLVTAAQAVHWFDRPRFWAEARRVLRRFYGETVGPFWPAERRLTEERYRTIDFPFAEFPVPDFEIAERVTLEDAAGYIRTWSATRGFVERHRRDPVDDLVTELTPVWGDPGTARLARWPIAMRAGRVS